MRYEAISQGEIIDLDGRKIMPIPANHVVPSVGYLIDSGRASLAFTGDTTTNDAFWPIINAVNNLEYLIIETAFCEKKKDIAIRSKHLCPSLLCEELNKMKSNAKIYITHLREGEADLTMREIRACSGDFNPLQLKKNQVFEF